ncbi:Probable ubiquitination network signaling protein acrB [Taphrina deformans PYCC 5710]|uniref:Probable ubiquitination network signaling protein acrB n=1 Tax=Taphrina deformans (strain PYCC 5710 / ATCC 11124 / CBS 356.35 / IMI 108563 / JCM 9778 / NBRC 8474) TaxID=1097556 RepID=R4XHQ6_TAPDE|nr:Probable ubiquitination network signaling protein acrB [Taphrina deformans PYCC 5710]|eukprot:CCG82947.1 Probable ubiquitination network signaling protein acrB [Taphrina deformans PYCC 5710]
MPVTTVNKRNRNATTSTKSRESGTEQSNLDPRSCDGDVTNIDEYESVKENLYVTPDPNIMQLSFKNGAAAGRPPTYPIADTIALLLILINFPNLLLTATQLLFSYKEHLSLSSTNAGNGLSIYMIVFMDVVVILFTAIVLPSLRSTITDISQIVVAVSIAGTDGRSFLPFATAFLSFKGIWGRLSCSSLLHIRSDDEFIRLQKSATYGTAPLCKYLNTMLQPYTEERSAISGMQYIKSAIAIHIIALGCVRLLNYWLIHSSTFDTGVESERVDQCDTVAIVPKAKRIRSSSFYATKSTYVSLWDSLLQLRAHSFGKRRDFNHCSNQFITKDVWISEISVRAVIFVVCTKFTDEPIVSVRVNGLPWEAKMSCCEPGFTTRQPTGTSWKVTVDNLSAKTEYDFRLEIGLKNQSSQYDFAVCTVAYTTISPAKSRAETQILPTLNTNLGEEQVHHVENQAHVSGPLSPITTLEDSITNACNKLEERKSFIRRIRKENSKKVQQLHRELEFLASKVNGSTDKNEQRVQGRMLSLQTEIKRTQDHIDELENEKKQTVYSITEQDLIWSQEKQKRDHEAQLFECIRQKYEIEKSEHQKRLSSVASDTNRIRAKADKLSLKRTKIQQELDRLSVEQDQLIKQEIYDRNSARECIRNQRLQTESEYLKVIHELQQRIEFLDVYGPS